jgi:DNA-binding response OmpR family regulator
MSDTAILAGAITETRIPTVYFIDDSATMREVVKIAFRKEKFNVIACPDAASALAQFEQTAPDVVITDVIMPDKDGYEVCQFIKQHERFGRTPVILMSGVVNRMVAEKATAVSADELIRKPFQPHELIVRVKSLLAPKSAAGGYGDSGVEVQPAPPASPHVLNSFFAPAQPPALSASPFGPPSATIAARPSSAPLVPLAAPASRTAPETQKLRNEIRRLELLVKKLQAELEAERQYCIALEAHFKSLQDSE